MAFERISHSYALLRTYSLVKNVRFGREIVASFVVIRGRLLSVRLIDGMSVWMWGKEEMDGMGQSQRSISLTYADSVKKKRARFGY